MRRYFICVVTLKIPFIKCEVMLLELSSVTEEMREKSINQHAFSVCLIQSVEYAQCSIGNWIVHTANMQMGKMDFFWVLFCCRFSNGNFRMIKLLMVIKVLTDFWPKCYFVVSKRRFNDIIKHEPNRENNDYNNINNKTHNENTVWATYIHTHTHNVTCKSTLSKWSCKVFRFEIVSVL